jgi:hypothetical protein
MYCQDYVEDKKRDSEMVEQDRLAQGWPKLVGAQNRNADASRTASTTSQPARSARRFMNQPHTANHGEWKGGGEIM